jgi:hypothetical protein
VDNWENLLPLRKRGAFFYSVIEQCHESISGHVFPHEPFEEFNYAAIDGGEPDEPHTDKTLAALMARIFKILDKGNTAKGLLIRYQALKYLFRQQDQPGLAKEIGVTKAAVSKVVRQVAEELGMSHPNMRDEATCEKFARETAQRHAIRKAGQLNPKLLQ